MVNQAPQKKIFLVDDHPVFREGLASVIRREADLTICGEAQQAPEAFSAIERLKPDLVLVDVGLPGKSGLELIRDLSAIRPDLNLLVISMHDESLYAERALRAGARGYVMKQAGPEDILRAIRLVLSGQIYYSARLAPRITEAMSGRRTNKPVSPIARLTDREFEILQLIGQGKDSHAIAHQLNLSSKTVDAHRGRIKEKLQLKSGMELVVYAARWMETEQLRGR